MQHYGLNTRLLDVTRNPLVAIFFAIDDKPEVDGAIYFGFMGDKENQDNAKIIARAAFQCEGNEITDEFIDYACAGYKHDFSFKAEESTLVMRSLEDMTKMI